MSTTKIVIRLENPGGQISIGIEKSDCDPVFFTPVNNTLEDVLPEIPEFLKKANTKWAEAPRNPVTTFKPPEQQTPTAAPTRTTTGSTTTAKPGSTAHKPAEDKLQAPMF